MNMQMQWGCHDGSVWPHNGEICNSLQSEQLLLWDKNRFEFCCHALGAFSIMLCVFNLLWSYCVACVPLIDTVREAVFSVPHGGSEISSVHVSFISTIVHRIYWEWGCLNALFLIQAASVKESHILTHWFLTPRKCC